MIRPLVLSLLLVTTLAAPMSLYAGGGDPCSLANLQDRAIYDALNIPAEAQPCSPFSRVCAEVKSTGRLRCSRLTDNASGLDVAYLCVLLASLPPSDVTAPAANPPGIIAPPPSF